MRVRVCACGLVFMLNGSLGVCVPVGRPSSNLSRAEWNRRPELGQVRAENHVTDELRRGQSRRGPWEH